MISINMKEVIYLGNANGIKNLVARKKYSVEFEGDEVYMITNEAGKRISYSKRFFEEETPPPPPPQPVEEVSIRVTRNGYTIRVAIDLRENSSEFFIELSDVNISCGIKQLSPFATLLEALSDLVEDLNLNTAETELVTILVLNHLFAFISTEVATGIIIFSIAESNATDINETVYRVFLDHINNEERFQSTDWVRNPNSNNMIGLYAYLVGDTSN